MLLRDKYSKYLNKYENDCTKIKMEQTPVVFFGASEAKLEIIDELLEQGIVIKTIIDNDPVYTGMIYKGIEVIIPDDYSELTTPVIMGINQAPIELFRQLKRLGFTTVIPYLAFLEETSPILNHLPQTLEFILNGYECWDLNKVILDSIDLIVTERCSLNCKDCSNLMPYFKSPQNSDMEELMHSFDYLYQSVDYILEVRLLGGEPLLNKHLPEYLAKLRNYSNIGAILLFTNGTIPFNEELLSEMSDPRIQVILSDYKNPKQKIDTITKVFDKRGICYNIQKHDNWLNCAVIKKNNRSVEENIQIMKECCISHTSVIKNGKLWRCPYASSLGALDALPQDVHQFIELHNSSLSKDELRNEIKKFLDLQFIKVCDYCNGRPRFPKEVIPAAIQAPQRLELPQLKNDDK